ncbi:2903_t:CDS:10 [Paraglomus brasilianum]|uniref:2903_t:CDS:1 n=1 Tax=Paraglomus brasilianum TaxID=144538 RepID=A0A9N8Z035_9GLOM|nr:2903_t:CDS:10 [Paraglomus brasilianum]
MSQSISANKAQTSSIAQKSPVEEPSLSSTTSPITGNPIPNSKPSVGLQGGAESLSWSRSAKVHVLSRQASFSTPHRTDSQYLSSSLTKSSSLKASSKSASTTNLVAHYPPVSTNKSNNFLANESLSRSNIMKSSVRSLSESAKAPSDAADHRSLQNNIADAHFTPTFARNPFSDDDHELFSNSTSVPSLSTSPKQLGGSSFPPTTSTQSEKVQEQATKEGEKRSSWDYIELLALDSFRNWILSFCVVKFDLELGQAMDLIYPSSDLTEEEKRNVCFLAFPDSNCFDEGDTVYNFRMRCLRNRATASGPETDSGFLYGYVFFRQKRDPTIRRGYFQKSLVFLSPYPYVGLFSSLVSILGPAYFEMGKPMLEAACHNVASWKPPSPGKTFELPFLGNVLHVEIPQKNKPQLLETSPFDMANYRQETQILASLPPKTLFSHFRDMIKDLWLCWELMVLAEPLALMAPDPKICSEAVVELVDLINPIPYCGDYRPYFTIHDTDFKSFVTKNKPPSNIILGVTNPFFNKAMQHWPNIIRVGKPKLRRATETSWRYINNPSSLDFVQGVTSKRKPVIAKDKSVLKLTAAAIAKGYPPDYLVNNTLRRYFVDLTEKFLVPLNRYFSTLIPVNVSLSSSREPPQLKPFKTDCFLKSLQDHGSQIPFKSKISATSTEVYVNFYQQFLKCGNFATWLHQRTIEAQSELRRRYLQVLCEDDVRKWMFGKDEVELIDLLVRIKDELKTPMQTTDAGQQISTRSADITDNSLLTAKQRDKLKVQARILVSGLPKDLRDSLAVNFL